jgi:transposase
MNFHLDALLNLPHITVETCLQQEQGVILKLSCLNERSDCPHCQQPTAEIHQNRPVLIRDLSVFGRLTHLQVPRRQFYCRPCQRYFTERLTFLDWEPSSIGNDDIPSAMKIISISKCNPVVSNKSAALKH